MTPAPPKPQKLIPNQDLRNHISNMPCLVRGCPYKSAYHHLRSVGAGGKDEFNLIPLCFTKHHTSGIHTMSNDDFEKKHNLPDLKSLAIVFTVGFLGSEEAVEKLALMRGIDMDSAEAIILNAIDNVNNRTKEWRKYEL